MPQTRECDYCGDDIPPGTGTMFVRTDGSAIHYCSSKCEKNADLGREPRDLEWIQDEEAEQLRRAEEGEDVAAAESSEQEEEEESAASDEQAEQTESEPQDEQAASEPQDEQGDAAEDDEIEDEEEAEA